MDLPIAPSDYQRYEKSVDLLKDVVAQISKDFRLNGFEVDFSGSDNAAYQELTSQLKPVIEYMLENQTETFWNLVYSIDLSEQKVKTILFGDEEEKDTILALTELILKRELQKVVILYYYSGKQLP